MLPDTINDSNKDNLATIAAIGVLAFIAANVAHEVVGHAVGLLLAGGREGTLTTTRLIYPLRLPSPLWRLFDLGGPMGNLVWAALCLMLQRLVRATAPGWRLFLWAGAMFSLFWEFGYLIKCGLSGAGDYMALIQGVQPGSIWRALLFLAGLFLYRSAIRMLAGELHFVVGAGEANWRPRLRRLLWTLYLAGGVTACAGAVLDPRGAGEIFRSGAASSFIACVGLVLVPASFALYPEKKVATSIPLRRNIPLTILANIIFLLFVFVLGPGIDISFYGVVK